MIFLSHTHLDKPAEYTHIGRPVTVGLRVREVSGILPYFIGFPVPVGHPMVGRPVGVGLRIRGVSGVFQFSIGFLALIGHPVIGCPVSVGRPVPDVFFCACSVFVCVRCKPDVRYARTGRPVRTRRPILMQAECSNDHFWPWAINMPSPPLERVDHFI